MTRNLIEENIQRHDQVADVYDTRHPEIYNPTEQRRLRETLNRALLFCATANPRLLDFGCGTGNLTEKLLSPEHEVWSADVSSGMLQELEKKFPQAVAAGQLRTIKLSGDFPLPFPDRHFAFVATYSVLHHVPDYLEAVREMARVVDEGGVLFIDHEMNTNYWHAPLGVRTYRLLSQPGYCLRRVGARLGRLIGRPESILPPPGQREIAKEGDIHIYADDCINWGEIRRITLENGFEELPFHDYLLCRESSRVPLRYLLCRPFASDTGIYVGRKMGRKHA